MTDDAQTFDFETSLAQLESLVKQLEGGDLKLEDALEAFEKGVRLTKDCQTALQNAEQKVQVLTEEYGEIKRQPFNPEEG